MTGSKGDRFVLGLVNDMRVIRITRCIEVPEVNTELQAMDLAIFTVTADRNDQVKTRLCTSLNKRITVGRIVTDRIGVTG